MASGSSGRPSSVSKGFDFDSDDILCSYDDFSNQESANGHLSDTVPAPNSSKGFEKNRMSRSSVYQAASYGQPDDSFHQDVISAVERSMKRHSENQMRFLEGISSRLSQLELYCYNLDKSIGEMRSDLTRDHTETDSKLKAVEKHLHEVHRSVQILRDKQELAETQKELAKLHLVQKDSSSSTHSQSNEEKASPSASDLKKNDNPPEGHNQQLALALPQQVAPQQQQISAAPQPSHVPQQNLAQGQPQTYYLSPGQLSIAPSHPQPPQSQYMTPDSQFRSNQMQGIPSQASQAPPPPSQQYPQYQQQWAQQPTMQQAQVRQQSNTVYSPYPPPGQPTAVAPQPQETLPMPTSYSAVPQPLSSRVDTVTYGYGTGRPVSQQLPPQQIKVPFGAQAGDGFTTTGTYLVYDGEGGRAHHQPPHFSQGGYSPSNQSLQSSQPGAAPNMMPRNPNQPQFVRSHPYNELIEKLVSMGFRGDHVISVIQRMEETGQPVDFNAVIDRLNVQPSGSVQRGWSG